MHKWSATISEAPHPQHLPIINTNTHHIPLFTGFAYLTSTISITINIIIGVRHVWSGCGLQLHEIDVQM